MTPMNTSRTTRWVRTGAFIAAAGLGAIGLALAGRALPRFDLTSAGDHRLSERTANAIAQLDEPATIVLALDESRIDRRALDRVGDVLDAFDATGSVRTRRIDTGSGDGAAELAALTEELVERERPAIESGVRTASTIASDLRGIAESLGRLSDLLRDTGEPLSLTARNWATQRAAFARVAATDLESAADAISTALVAPGIPDPATAAGTTPARLATLDEQLAQIRGQAGVLGDGSNEAVRAIEAIRETAAQVRERAMRLERPEVSRIAQVLRSGEAALVISGAPPGTGRPTIAAIELETLFPPVAGDAGQGLSVAGEAGARAESLFGDALAALVDATPPVVVFVHGEPSRFVGQPAILGELLSRLRARGIDVREWAVAVDPERPSLGGLNPGGLRPVVWVVISPDSAAGGSERRDGTVGPSGTERVQQVASLVGTLMDEGASVLLNLNPSVFPTFGGEDPMAALVERFGVTADSGRTVLRDAVVGGRPVVESQHAVRTESDHPVAAAARGLGLNLPWPVSLRVDAGDRPGKGPPAAGIAGIEDDSSWAESEWVRLWRTPSSSRALLPDPPVFGEGDQRGPFTVAAAAESAGQRVVVVGSNTWMFDPRWAERRAVDGRVVLAAPGNPALFEASVLWLAGKDELMGRGVEASSVARVRSLGDGTLTMLRWALVAGIPIGVLVVGVVVVSRRR